MISPLEFVAQHPGMARGIRLYLKRDDLLHPDIQGNKWRKLLPVLELFPSEKYAGILSFGGPFSNHLYALAAAGRVYGIPTAGIVRGEHADLDNPTLAFARAQGMQLERMLKTTYDALKSAAFQVADERWRDYFILPEGGATPQAVQRCEAISREIFQELDVQPGVPVYVATPAGTGSTAAGVIAGLPAVEARVLVFPAANYGVDDAEIRRLLELAGATDKADRFSLYYDASLGRFASFHPELTALAARFKEENGVLLDPIYTTRMMHGLFALMAQDYFPAGSIVVAVHTGGLQGWGDKMPV